MRSNQFDSVRGFEANLMTWARIDCSTMVDWTEGRLGGRPLLWLDRSPGGQIPGNVERPGRIAAVLTVAAGKACWRDYVPGQRRMAPLLWDAVVPVTLRFCGYFPGRRLRMIGDLPRGAMCPWRSSRLQPDYLFGVEDPHFRVTYAGLSQPILSLAFTDDEHLSECNIDALHAFCSSAVTEMGRLAPAELGIDRDDHFGFFRRRHAERLWPLASDWLAART
jgi:predicted alpha/beta hydrolase